jgi:hypothetical protein
MATTEYQTGYKPTSPVGYKPLDKRKGAGKYSVQVDTAHVFQVLLFNFDIDGTKLKDPGHTQILQKKVLPLLRSGWTGSVLGLASTTGDRTYDLKLSQTRATEVSGYLVKELMKLGGDPWRIQAVNYQGKDAALKAGRADNKEEDEWRGAVVRVWDELVPPTAQDIAHGMDISELTGANSLAISIPINPAEGIRGGIEILNGIFLAGDIVGITEITEIAAAGTMTFGLLAVAPILLAVADVLALPLIFASADRLASFNGRIQGEADAIQDMADQYSDAGLDRIPLSQWPAVQVPTPHVPDSAMPNDSAQAWRNGQAVGRRDAVQAVIDLEQNPRPVTLKSGKTIKLTGRLWLRALSKTFKDNAGIEVVIIPVNEELKKENQKWPVHK